MHDTRTFAPMHGPAVDRFFDDIATMFQRDADLGDEHADIEPDGIELECWQCHGEMSVPETYGTDRLICSTDCLHWFEGEMHDIARRNGELD